MGDLESIKLQLKLGQLPQLWALKHSKKIDVDKIKRQWKLTGKADTGFEVFLQDMIVQQIPTTFLEGYPDLMVQIQGLNWPKNPKVILTSNSHISNDVFKAWAGDKIDKGSSLVIGQHGGHYGTGRLSSNEEHEIAISSVFFSWGWRDHKVKKVKPVGMLKRILPLDKKKLCRKEILLITTATSQKSYRMYSATISRQWLDHFNDNCNFVKNLPVEICN